MKVLNQHQRKIGLSAATVGVLIDSLASENDLLWPVSSWPKMKFEKPLAISAKGGHGSIRYFVETYLRGKSIGFRFMGPSGFHGFHRFDVIPDSNNTCCLQHTLEMNASGLALITWPLIYRPLHDALIEDALATAQLNLQISPKIVGWSYWVRCLRWIMSGGKSKTQTIRSTIKKSQ
jgi:hypothetical protein